MTITAPTPIPGTTAATTAATAAGRPQAFGRLLTTLLVAAPAVMAVGRLLHVPFDSNNAAGWEATLRAMAAHQARSDSGWLLVMVAAGLLSVTGVILAQRLMAAGRARSGGFCLITLAVAWASSATDAGTALIMSGMARSTDLAGQAAILQSYNTGVLKPGIVFLTSIVGAVGYITLAVASARAHLMSRVAAVVLALGGAGTLLTNAGPLTPMLVVAALLLGVGHVLAARTAPAA